MGGGGGNGGGGVNGHSPRASGVELVPNKPVERVDLVGVARKCVKGRLGLGKGGRRSVVRRFWQAVAVAVVAAMATATAQHQRVRGEGAPS